MYDCMIKNANLYLGGGELLTDMDLAVKDGRIVKTARMLDPENAKQVYYGEGRLVVPGFMDTHMHIDKAFTMDNDQTVSLIEACANSDRRMDCYYGWSDEEIYQEIMEHSSKAVEWCIVHGTTLLRTNVLFHPNWKTIALTVMNDLKVKYADYITIQSCVSFPDEFRDELCRAAERGEIDVIGGYPHLCPDHRAVTEDCFRLAQRYQLPVDLHCDESDVTNLDCLEYITECTGKYGMEGRVTCGHVTGLNASGLKEERAERIIRNAAEVRLNVTSLTSCNMYLMNSARRGPTRVRQLAESGVNVSVASDNIRDTFRPFGNCDLLEEALLTAQVHKFGTVKWLRKTMDMITYHPAVTAMAEHYGLQEGCYADFFVINAPTPEEAILRKASRDLVFRRGKLVSEKGALVRTK